MALKRILIADNDPTVVQTLVGYLRNKPYEIETAQDSIPALGLIFCNSFDLVVIGLEMPNLNGLEILQKMRSNECEMPVMLLCRHGSLMQALDAMRLGARGFLHKPVSNGTFLKTVDNILELSLSQLGGKGEKRGIIRQDRIQHSERLRQSLRF